MALKEIDVSLAEVVVESVDGEPLRLGELVGRPTVLVIPRYYGCLPCRGYLRELSENLDQIDAAGGGVLAVSVGAAHQARWLMEHKGVRFPLLVDPQRRVYDALDLPRRWWVGLTPKGWCNYVRAIARDSRQGRIVEPNQLPGLALLNERATAVRLHRGSALGDYPPISEVAAELRQVSLS
jgi:peroxiredoxin